MKKKIIYTDEPLGELQVVEDFLPPPEQLVFKEEKAKITACKRVESSQSMSYSPAPFDTHLANSRLGRDLWDFLNQGPIIELMEKATRDEKPPVKLLGRPLLERFEKQFIEREHGEVDEIKRMIGRMIRQILEGHGYRLVPDSNVEVRPSGGFFATGSVYEPAE